MAQHIGFSIYLDGKLIDELSIDRPIFNVGKLSTSTVRLDDVNVSRKHAVIERREDGTWRITDLGSTNGTMLRGERVEQARLRDGDRLLIGRTTLVVRLDESPSAVAYTPPVAQSGATPEAPPIPRPTPRRPAPLDVAAHAPLRASGFRLPRGSMGHALTMIGALAFLAGSVLMPWRVFELAGLDVSALGTGALGILMTLVGGSTLVASTWAFVTGRRHAAARYNLGASLATVVWLVAALVGLDWGASTMQAESVGLGGGFIVAAWGALVMIGGAATVFGALPRWDETTSFLRLLVSREDKALHDIVVYEPRVVDLATEAAEGLDAAARAKLPRFEVTREGDAYVSRGGVRQALTLGERGAIDVDGTRVLYLFVKPVADRGPVALTSRSEAVAFALLALLATLSLGLDSILSGEPDARRDIPDEQRRVAKIEPVMIDEQSREEERTVQVELEEPREIPLPEVAVDEDLAGDDSDVAEPIADPAEDPSERPSELVDQLNEPRDRPTDLEQLSPEDRATKARELAQRTALHSVFDESNPLYADVMQLDADVDRRIDVVAALDKQGTFIAGSVDPFGGTLGPGGGFPGGPGDGQPDGPDGGPEGGRPAVKGVFEKDPRRQNLDDVEMTERELAPIVVEKKVRVSGGELDEKTVQQYIRRYLPGIKWCYQDRLQQNRSLGGKVLLAFTIMPDGGVTHAHTEQSTLGDAQLDACIVGKVARWRFPSPKDGGVVDVVYPLILKTQ